MSWEDGMTKEEEDYLDLVREQRRKEKIENGRGSMKPGALVRCIDAKGNNGLVWGELFVVVHGDKYPILKRSLIRKVGLDSYNFFVCVEGTVTGTHGFFAWPRFEAVKGLEA